MTISLHLPFPPSANVYYRRGPKSTYLSKPGIAYKVVVADEISRLGYKLEDGRLDVFVALSSPTKRKYDLDNRIKPLQDAMQDAGLYDDDEQIDRLTVVRHPPSKGGYCKVVVVKALDNVLADRLEPHSGEASSPKGEVDRRVGDAACRYCGGNMKPSKAIAQTWTGKPEWPGDTIYTMSPGGPGKLIDCLKCEQCGHSVGAPLHGAASAGTEG